MLIWVENDFYNLGARFDETSMNLSAGSKEKHEQKREDYTLSLILDSTKQQLNLRTK